MPNIQSQIRRVCFVTGTRAEFGLMGTTLAAIKAHPRLQLQIVATGMHVSKAHGQTIDQIRQQGWSIDARVPWPARPSLSVATAHAMAGLSRALDCLRSDIVLVVGDRVEAFAGAAAGHLGGRVVAHVHGGDRALGQTDDALRHAITKLAHVHFPATAESAARLLRLGEDRWRIFQFGAPGIDGITRQVDAGRERGRFALLVLHPTDADEKAEERRATLLARVLMRAELERIVVIHPNNDAGWSGIARAWKKLPAGRFVQLMDVPRGRFLAMMRDAALMIGNSSAGIIEAASFGTPVIDIGPRQQGRERSENVTTVPFRIDAIARAIENVLSKKARPATKNAYGGSGTGRKIAGLLARVALNPRLKRKLITY